MPIGTKLLIAGAVLIALIGLTAAFGYSQRQIGDAKAKSERAEADKTAIIENQMTVTKELEKVNRELKKTKEERDASKDRLNRVADPTGCLDVDLGGTDFGRELRRAYGNAGAP